jgi:lysophospholipase L1-like esterase
MSVGLTWFDRPDHRLKGRLKLVAAFAGAMALCAGLAFWAGTKQVRGLSSEVYAQQRLPTINSRLSEAGKGFIFLAGDSHAELINATYRLCGREVVNGGVSGAKAELYKNLAPQLTFVPSPHMVVLAIGTNDIARKKGPLAPASMSAFEENIASIVASFRKVAPRIVVMAVPPISPELAEQFEIGAVAAYSDRLHALCAREGCDFVDPYSALREQDGSAARPDMMRDGVHFRSYRAIHERLGALLCPNGSL